MSWLVLRPQIATVLQGISTIQEVASSPKVKFNGYPAAHVIPSDNSGDYETTTENVRTYSFIVRVFYDTKETDIGTALTALEEVVDSVIDAFDQEDLKGTTNRTVGMSLPNNYTFLNIFACPGRYGELPEDQLLMAEIIVKVRISIDIT